MTATNFDTEQEYDERFPTFEVFRNDWTKTGCGYFGPGQFVPVHGPSSDVAVYEKFEAKASPFREGMNPTNSIQPPTMA
ncbi:cupin 2 barrel domain-containing protein [Haloferax denitrificans ATCC 35960]|uniref:Cupin 2 barrel domain-containing protein n=1 Tax=Haloferax denitrificans ATCC 35960 TaxID=662478 RepID=M0JJ72_9EURY|nr:hypothetical protein [Haloferax sp. Q22]EMA08004.1 cupin 2 barrel domain-containing protein [Haloferax denitrificans ATCC 35960]